MDTKTKLETKIAKDQSIIRALKANEIIYHIGFTDTHQSIDFSIKKDETTYQFFLDSTPLEAEQNDKMLTIYGLK